VHPIPATKGRSHLSHVVLETDTWEASIASQLEASPLVQTYARNDHLELAIPYTHLGQPHHSYPDFLVRLTTGTHLLLEVKGHETEQDRQKAQAARRWCEAVNAWSHMGTWTYATCPSREALPGILASVAAARWAPTPDSSPHLR
jgi:type III restriction enzyme